MLTRDRANIFLYLQEQGYIHGWCLMLVTSCMITSSYMYYNAIKYICIKMESCEDSL